MITGIEIFNFQSHKNSELKFCNGVNAIVGNSDSGKTAIIRALNWVLNNRPSGDSFRSNWGGETIVDVIFDDCTISRIKGDENKYFMHGQDFKALNGNVPDEIREAINMSEVNVQYQLDSPFMLSASSGEVAKTLNKIANLTSIDNAISNIKKKVTSTNREIEDIERQIKELEESEKGFDYLTGFEKLVVMLEKAEVEENETFIKKNYLKERIKEIERNQLEIDALESILTVEPLLEQALTYLEEQKGLNKQITGLSDLMRIIKRHDERIVNLISEQNTNERLFDELMPNKCPLCNGEIK